MQFASFRKPVSLLLPLVLFAGLSACGGAEEKASGEPMNGLPGAEQSSIKIAISTADPHLFALQLAVDKGIFEKYGIDAKTVLMEGVQPVQAVISGQVEVATSNAAQVVTSLTTTEPLVDLGIFVDGLPDILFGSKGIKNADDLRGKKVAISNLGGQSHAEVVLGLKELGLTPDDVLITEVGAEGVRVGAMQSGSVAAAPVDPSLEAKLAKEGITPLVDLRESELSLPGGDIMFRRSFVDKNPNLALVVVAAALEAVQLMFTDTDEVSRLFAKWAGITEEESIGIWDAYLASNISVRNLRATTEGYENIRDVLVSTNPAVADVDVSKAYDSTYLDKLEDLGFFEKFGVPES